MHTREKIAQRASLAGLSLAGHTIDGLNTYFELLRQWNRKVSLTALPVEESGDEAIDRLLIEPMVATRYVEASSGNMLDVGSGGGSPAIPMKLVLSGMSLQMVESRARKAAFLREVVRALELDGAEVLTKRYQELSADGGVTARIDVLTVRAVRLSRENLSELRSFLAPNGAILLFTAAGTASTDLRGTRLERGASGPLLPHWGSRVEVLQKTEF